MESLQQRVESWIRDQRSKLMKVTWPQQWPTAMKWPWIKGREQRKRMHEEFQRRKKQLHNLCIAVKADSLSDLQDVLCCMVLSECVYKRPDAELLQAVNKFKADFDGQVVCLERIQPSSDHVPHRYLLAETGDTLFASFIGTKQYKDMMADANILQGAIFHDDVVEDTDEVFTKNSLGADGQKKGSDDVPRTLGAKPQQGVASTKPAAHRGFMSRAKGIPALELYKLAQKKKRKLVLCGHSLGGAVAVLSTLAILRVIASASSSKEQERIPVKCITFSQPPVGNAALRDYVNEKGWQQYFKTYCIPEDLVPRILSPAYFHHYNAHQVDSKKSTLSMSKKDTISEKQKAKKENENEQLVLGLGPVNNSFWRLSKLVPLDAVRRQLNKYTGNNFDSSVNSAADSNITSSIEDVEDAPQSLEIEEDSDGISLKPFPITDKGDLSETINGNSSGKSKSTDKRKAWHRVPTLPSYVPFGQLYLLGNSSVESLSGAEYSKLTSVRSVIAELRERLQSHSMRSYRSRFQR
ncbi:putative fungal lipase-like domain, alpha/Beta hydrolase [Helianthus annuus]|nr:putative fungal lipase-like domain, alpha/Beta hydrolase [Helianthus annuus]